MIIIINIPKITGMISKQTEQKLLSLSFLKDKNPYFEGPNEHKNSIENFEIKKGRAL
jgi:hypothetical protein